MKANDGRPIYELAEWRSRTLPPDIRLTEADRTLVARLAPDSRLVVEEFRDGIHLRSSSWVGTVRFAEFEVRVVPKYVGGTLPVLRMLEFSLGLNGLHRLPAARQLAVGEGGLQDLIGRLLAEEATRIVQDGLLQDYVTREEALPMVRGRLLPLEQVTRHPGRIDVLECRFDEFETDIDENRLVALGLEAARGICGHPDVRREVNRVRPVFAEACDPLALDPRYLDAPIDYHRRNDRYRQAHGYAKLLLAGLGVHDLYAAGAADCYAFMIDMDRVFEGFVSQILKAAFDGEGVEVAVQRHVRGRIVDAQSGRTYATVIPDVVLRVATPAGWRELPVDAKYKLYAERTIDNGDLYQVFFYAFVHRTAQLEGAESARAVLMYPSEGPHRQDLRFTDLRGVNGALLTGLGLNVGAALDALENGKVDALPFVHAISSLLEVGSVQGAMP
jgi:5-methylcytosine-specific restriction enzyme subunit McrC